MIAHILIGFVLLILVESAVITSLMWITINKDTESMPWMLLETILCVTALAVGVIILISVVTVSVGIISEHFPQLLEI